MKRLGKQAEERIVAALESASDMVDSGLHPNAALAKAASQGGVPASQVHLLVYAYNNAANNDVRENGKTVLEKAATVPLASTPTVLELMYPDKPLTRADLAREKAASEDYFRAPVVIPEPRHPSLIKTAEDLLACFDKAPEIPDFINPVVRQREKQAEELDKLRHLRDCSVIDVENSWSKAAAASEALTAYFRTPGSMSFYNVRENCRIMYQGSVEPLFAKIAATLTPEDQRPPLYGNSEPALGWPYTKVQEAVDNAIAFHVASAHLEKISSQVSEMEKQYAPPGLKKNEPMDTVMGKSRKLPPFRRKSVLEKDIKGEEGRVPAYTEQTACGPVGDYCEKKADDGAYPASVGVLRKSGAGMFGTGIGLGSMVDFAKNTNRGQDVLFRLAPKNFEQRRQNVLDDLAGSKHDMEMGNIRQQAMLNDFLSNDEVLSTHDPKTVIGYYNDISKLAPRASKQPLIMRAILRKYCSQGSVDPYEADMLVQLEGRLREVDIGKSNLVDMAKLQGQVK